MTQHATIKDNVTYRPGDGAPIEIPPGPAEVELAPDSATLSWTEENGAAGVAASPLTQYKEYVSQKQIKPEKTGAVDGELHQPTAKK